MVQADIKQVIDFNHMSSDLDFKHYYVALCETVYSRMKKDNPFLGYNEKPILRVKHGRENDNRIEIAVVLADKDYVYAGAGFFKNRSYKPYKTVLITHSMAKEDKIEDIEHKLKDFAFFKIGATR